MQDTEIGQKKMFPTALRRDYCVRPSNCKSSRIRSISNRFAQFLFDLDPRALASFTDTSPLTTTVYTHRSDEELQDRLRGLGC